MNDDEKWMRQTIALAERGSSGASPNPLVGCVIVKNGKLVGEGYHAFFGGPHAEINAIKKAGGHCKNATLYTNLEPCCHWGKTPPCSDAIIRAEIRKVVAAISDPNPLVKNKGFEKLKKAGVLIEKGVCQSQAQDLNRAFLKFVSQGKPYVLLKAALSLDGKIATKTGDSKWITSKASRNFSHRLRAQADAIMVGAETVRKDNPALTSHGKGRNPVRVVLASTGKLPARSNIFNAQAPTWIFHSNEKLSRHNKLPKAEWFYCKSNHGKMDFQEILRQLAVRKISKLLIEGGGTTAASALESGAVDELYFFIAPILIGGATAKTIFEGAGIKKISDAVRFTQLTAQPCDRDLLVNARIKLN